MTLLERIRSAFSGVRRDPGEGTGRQGPRRRDAAEPGASDDARRLEVEGDPRGGFQAPEYRRADPRELVVAEGVAMMGPGGAPVDDSRLEQKPTREPRTEDPVESGALEDEGADESRHRAD